MLTDQCPECHFVRYRNEGEYHSFDCSRRSKPRRQSSEQGASICEWVVDDSTDGEIWETTCSNAFCFNNDDGPAGNHMNFCCYCGKSLREVRIHRDDYED